MTKRKPSDGAKKAKKKAPVVTTPTVAPVAAMESILSMIGGGPRGSALQQAQELMYQAWEAPSAARRVALARRALEVSANCADAYVLLADHAGGLAEAIALMREGVAAGERALGKRAFEDDVGHFWGLIETRPYMRARAGLAQLLRAIGRHDESVAHYRELLRLNPNDNQGLRYELAVYLLELGLDDELAALVEAYRDDASATWAYTAALLAFRQGGDGEAARQRLDAAKKANPHVPVYLLGQKKLPRQLPEYVGLGDEDEAVAYASVALAAWKQSAGALDWLRGR